MTRAGDDETATPARRRRLADRPGVVAAAVVVGAVIALGGCAPRRAPPASEPSDGRRLRTAAAPTVSSNVLRADYAGSAACAPCHGDVVAVWQRSPMHRMTRLPEATEIRAPFDGREFHFKRDVARFERVGDARFIRLQSADRGTHIYRVTKVIGGRYREDFAGVEVAAADPAAAVLGDPHAELILPASYVFQSASFRLKGYSVMVTERPGMRAGGVWNQTCIFCHNTVPYFDDLWGALYGPGAPGYQGEVVDRLLPPRAGLRYTIGDATALGRALGDEVAVLRGGALSGAGFAAGGGVAIGDADVNTRGAAGRAADAAFDATSDATSDAASDSARAALRRAILDARARFEPRHFVEVGIGCEACHGGARAHVDDPHQLPTFEPRAPFLQIGAGDGSNRPISNVEWQNRACARCHQVLFSKYARTWEGGTRRALASAGGSHITSGEGRDFLLGGCARVMACTTCHDPHAEDQRARLDRLATPAGNGVCTGCHRQLAGDVELRAHAHHDPRAAGGSCVACHMPRKNMGLGYALTRYHRIGSPTDTARVEGDRPLECAICHADKSVGALLDDIARFWGKRYDAQAIDKLYGARNANVVLATIDRGWAHEQAAAIGIAGERRFRPALSKLGEQAAANPYPLVRAYARAAAAAIEGRPIPTDDGDTSTSGGPVAPPAHGRAGAGVETDDED